MTLLDDTASTLADVAHAASSLATTLRGSQVLQDPTGLGNLLTCGEANAFIDLFDALDLGDLAAALREQHMAADGDDEKENHVP